LKGKISFFKMGKIESFENLLCWQACREVISLVRKTIQSLPIDEKYDLVSNMRRAARSTTRNIAEGFGRHHHKENIQFCRISRGSLNELLDDFITCHNDEYISEEELKKARICINNALKILNGYINYLKRIS
jgi:four helix bundle protein